MLITRFNKLIKSKILLVILAFVVSLAFVGLPVASRFLEARDKTGLEGKLFEKKIPSVDFRLARYFALGLRRDAKLTKEEHEFLRRRTWERLAALEAANRLGIRVSDDEVVAILQNDTSFHINGIFNSNKFRQLLYRIGIPEEHYEQYLRQEIKLSKMADIITASTWVPHAEAVERAGSLMDSFVAEYAFISNDELGDDAVVSDDNCRKFYDDNMQLFVMPEKINVRYVRFPITPDPEGVTNDAARSATAHEAAEFVMAMAPGRYSKGLTMEEAAAKYEKTIQTTEYFSAIEDVPGIDAGLEFNRVSFSLDPDDPEHCFSDAVIGKSNMYVIATLDRKPAETPPFEDIKDQVRPLALEDARTRAARAAYKNIHSSVKQGVDSGKTFAESAAALGMNVITTGTFNVYEGILSNDFDYADIIIPTVISLEEKEVSSMIPVDDGALLISVAERIPADIISLQAMKPQVISMIERYRSRLVFEDWRTYNLEKAGLTDYHKRQLEDLPFADDAEDITD